MFYRLLECLFFFNKPIVEIYCYSASTQTVSKIIYQSEFEKLKSMDDLFRAADIYLPKKYSVKWNLLVYNPWSPVTILDHCEIVTDKILFYIQMKKIYGGKFW
jgi:hypothetical protein